MKTFIMHVEAKHSENGAEASHRKVAWDGDSVPDLLYVVGEGYYTLVGKWLMAGDHYGYKFASSQRYAYVKPPAPKSEIWRATPPPPECAMMICASCRCDLYGLMATGVSGLYNPGPRSFLLCESCWLDEEALIDEVGTNVQPDVVKLYAQNQPEGYNG